MDTDRHAASERHDSPVPTDTVRPATADDVTRATRTLRLAFTDYPLTRHTVDARDYPRRVGALQELFLTRIGLPYGRVWVAEQGGAVTVWTTPEHDIGPVFAEIAPAVAELAGDRAAAHHAAEAALGPHRPAEPVWFLATIGVDPDRQGRGLGRAVLLPGLDGAERAGVPAFLETSTADNVRFYQRLGFEVTAEVDLPDGGPRTWCMMRRPG